MNAALEFLRQSLERKPEDWQLRARVTTAVLKHVEDPAEALKLVAGAPAPPDTPEAQEVVFRVLEQHPLESLIPMLGQWVERAPDSAFCHFILAQAHEANGDMESAATHRLVAATIDPHFSLGEPSAAGPGEVEPDDREGEQPVSPVVPVTVASPPPSPPQPQAPVPLSADSAPGVPPPTALSVAPPVMAVAIAGTGDEPPAGVAWPEEDDGFHVPPPPKPRRTKEQVVATVVTLAFHIGLFALLAAIVIAVPRLPPPEIVATPMTTQEVTVERRVMTPPTPQPTQPKMANTEVMVARSVVTPVSVPIMESDLQDNFDLGVSMGTSAAFGGPAGGGIGFFGVQSEGATVLVIDISGSMEMSGREYTPVEDEAIKVVQSLPSRTLFNLVMFAGAAHVFREERMAVAGPETISSAVEWMKDHSPATRTVELTAELGRRPRTSQEFSWGQYRGGLHGGTRADLALKACFELDPPVETIYFLSDGHPTGASVEAIYDLVEEFQQQRRKRAVIHTFSYQSESGRDFLQELAKRNEGRYREL